LTIALDPILTPGRRAVRSNGQHHHRLLAVVAAVCIAVLVWVAVSALVSSSPSIVVEPGAPTTTQGPPSSVEVLSAMHAGSR
jgi:hypothetical protein